MKYVSVELTYVTKSQAALGFEIPESLGIFWLPKLEIKNIDEIIDSGYSNGDKVEVEIPDWLATKNALDPYCEEIDLDEAR